MDAGRFVYLCTWVTTTKSSGHVLCTPSCTIPEVLSGSWSFAEITPELLCHNRECIGVEPSNTLLMSGKDLLGRSLVARRWWHMPLISALGRQRQVDLCEFKASLELSLQEFQDRL